MGFPRESSNLSGDGIFFVAASEIWHYTLFIITYHHSEKRRRYVFMKVRSSKSADQIYHSSSLSLSSLSRSTMDFHISNSSRLLIILSLLCLQARAESTGSVFFLDSPSHQFLRTRSSDAVAEIESMSLPEVGAAVSVLLGLSPPATLSAASSFKLNEVLMPNPFDRPRAVFMLEVRKIKDSQLAVDLNNAMFSSAFRSKVIVDSNKADIQLPGEDEVSIVPLDEPLSFNCIEECTDKDINDFASWLGGSYVTDTLEPLNGELTIPLGDAAELNLHLSKKAEREFTASLVSLIHNIRRAMEMHQDLLENMRSPAQLLTGCFDGIKALEEQYGPEGVAQQGVELFLSTMSKMFDSLQAAYKGQIVGVIFFNGTPPPQADSMLNVMFTSRPSSRWLEEKEESIDWTAIARMKLVRLTLAWTTGLILVVATLLGIYFLLNMPLTRDSLLYSNVKLD